MQRWTLFSAALSGWRVKGEEADRKEISVFFAGTTPMPLSQNSNGLLFVFFFICFFFVSGALNAVL